MSNNSTTHTVRYEQPGILSALPYNKVAQFALGLVILIVVWNAYWSGWFSMFAYKNLFEQPMPSEGMGTPIGLIPFLLDAVCLVGLGGFALIGLILGAIGPLWSGLAEWMASFRAERAATSAATTASATPSGIRGSSGRELSLEESIRSLQLQINAVSARLESNLDSKTDLEATLQRVIDTKTESDKTLALIQQAASQVSEPTTIAPSKPAARKPSARKTGASK